MSVVCAVIKGKTAAICSDTLNHFGSIQASAKHLKNASKLHNVNDSIMGVVGWNAITSILEHLIEHESELFMLNNRDEIFSSMLKIHPMLKSSYFIETREEDDQPVESSQLDALLINPQGLFEIGSYKEVNEYNRFWSIGSGRHFALGAMDALYESTADARHIVEAGVKAACEFDDGCGLPLETRTLQLECSVKSV